jgi:hypothetical protein
MVAAFGLAHEGRPGELTMPLERLKGVGLTLLHEDGTAKADVMSCKKMIGASSGWPIVVAPANDAGGLAITEGVEDALSLHRACGLGAWAAGAANRLPKLAELVPEHVEAVTIAVDDDPAGRRGSYELAERLHARGFEVTVLEPRTAGRPAA